MKTATLIIKKKNLQRKLMQALSQLLRLHFKEKTGATSGKCLKAAGDLHENSHRVPSSQDSELRTLITPKRISELAASPPL